MTWVAGIADPGFPRWKRPQNGKGLIRCIICNDMKWYVMYVFLLITYSACIIYSRINICIVDLQNDPPFDANGNHYPRYLRAKAKFRRTDVKLGPGKANNPNNDFVLHIFSMISLHSLHTYNNLKHFDFSSTSETFTCFSHHFCNFYDNFQHHKNHSNLPNVSRVSLAVPCASPTAAKAESTPRCHSADDGIAGDIPSSPLSWGLFQ